MAPGEVKLSTQDDGTLVIDVEAHVHHPDSLMPANLRPLYQTPSEPLPVLKTPSLGPDGGTLLQPAQRDVRTLTHDEARTWVTGARRQHQQLASLFQVPLRPLVHTDDLVTVAGNVLSPMSGSLKKALATSGTYAQQLITRQFENISPATGNIVAVFPNNGVFGDQMEMAVRTGIRGPYVLAVVDSGLDLKHGVPSSLSIGHGTSATTTLNVQGQLTGGTAYNVGQPGSIQVSQGLAALLTLYNRGTTRGVSQTLTLSSGLGETRTGRKVRLGIESVGFDIAVRLKSLDPVSSVVSATPKTGFGGAVVRGGAETFVDLADAKQLGLITDGLPALPQPSLWLPPSATSSFVSLRGMLDAEHALDALAEKLGGGKALPKSMLGREGETRVQVLTLFTSDALNSAHHYQLVREGMVITTPHGDLRVRLVPGKLVYQGLRHGVTVDEDRALSLTQARNVTNSVAQSPASPPRKRRSASRTAPTARPPPGRRGSEHRSPAPSPPRRAVPRPPRRRSTSPVPSR